jgi:hypothetical protein
VGGWVVGWGVDMVVVLMILGGGDGDADEVVILRDRNLGTTLIIVEHIDMI